MKIKLTKQGKIATIILITGLIIIFNFAFAKWQDVNAYQADYSAASAAQFFGVAESDVIAFDYELAGKKVTAYAVETPRGIQVAFPDFSRTTSDDWKWEWLQNTIYEKEVQNASNQ